MTSDIYNILLVGLFAFALLVIDRHVRINPFLANEGFQVHGYPTRCGTDLPPCSHGKRCMNGFCRSEDIVQLYDRNPLPVVP